MIRGPRVDGLLRYLYGPGDHEEHLDPHLIASWSGRENDPARAGETGLRRLADLMNQPLWLRELSLGRPVNNPVWHFPVRAAPTDPILTDQQWNTISRRIVAAAGIAPDGDLDACRWIAVRHADDHVHIVATLARADGNRVDHHNDALRARAELLRIETELGLRSTAPADRTARRDASRKELRKSHRHGEEIPMRERLEPLVRKASINATDEREFFALLESYGLRVFPRTNDTGDITGFSVAMPGDRDKDGAPIRYSGSTLSPDLSLTKIRQRLREYQDAEHRQTPQAAPFGPRQQPPNPQPLNPHPPGSQPPRPQPQDRPAPDKQTSRADDRAQTWERAAEAISDAASALPEAGDADADAIMRALSDALTIAADNAPPPMRDQIAAAAHSFQRAAQIPTTQQPDEPQSDTQPDTHDQEMSAGERHARQAADDLRLATRALGAAGRAFANGRDATAVWLLIASAVVATRAAYHWLRGHGHRPQAQAAQEANAHLRTALNLRTVNHSPNFPYDSVAAQDQRLHTIVRNALASNQTGGRRIDPATILKDPHWPRLAAVLRQAENRGHDPQRILAAAIAERSLSDAHSVPEVLSWRIQRTLTRDTPLISEPARNGQQLSPQTPMTHQQTPTPEPPSPASDNPWPTQAPPPPPPLPTEAPQPAEPGQQPPPDRPLASTLFPDPPQPEHTEQPPRPQPPQPPPHDGPQTSEPSTPNDTQTPTEPARPETIPPTPPAPQQPDPEAEPNPTPPPQEAPQPPPRPAAPETGPDTAPDPDRPDRDAVRRYTELLTAQPGLNAIALQIHPTWPVLTEVLHQAETAGHSAADLVQAAVQGSDSGIPTPAGLAWKVREQLNARRNTPAAPAANPTKPRPADTNDLDRTPVNRPRQGPHRGGPRR
ncbi:hypothetical protein [Actinomadura violacea]|uniref:Mobilization protein n=1 Tax=Actinomadura violacea TaxID=2819934 RepID=A0ABS3S7I1_9ACTN|nr:hypothetical protein [Actinomadura violacea]MBO2464957.1 hypothetical protein [Actinomadura violacea]